MGARCYIIPDAGLTLTDQKNFKINALAAGIESCGQKKIGTPYDDLGIQANARVEDRLAAITAALMLNKWPQSIDCREAQPTLDFAATNDRWETAALAAAGTAYTVFNGSVAPALAANKLAVFWGITVETVPCPVGRVTHRSGGAAGNIIAQFDLEQLASQQEVSGYYSEPVIVYPSITFAVQVLARIATGVLARVPMRAFIFEPSGQTIA